jgi:hypothetical protein
VKVASIKLTEGTEIRVPWETAQDAHALAVSFRDIADPCAGEQPVYRMCDIGAGAGLFAAFAAMRWPYAWIDAYEAPSSASSLLRMNAQPGTRFFNELPETLPRCDALHVGPHVHGLEFDVDRLAELRVVLWEFATDEQFENVAGFMRAFGLQLAHVAMVDRGPPVRGWQLWIRRKQ